MEDLKQFKQLVGGLKVIFVDDEDQIRKSTGVLLEKFFDEVQIFDNGQEALEAFQKTKDFDIVITDIQMPKLNGIDMVKQMKEIKKDIFVIFITATRGEKEIDHSMYDMYITKPIAYDDIKLMMQKVKQLV